MFILLFIYTHIISNQKKFLLRRLRKVFLKEIAELDWNINFGYVTMRRRGLLGMTRISPEKWEIQKVYRKEKEV